MPLSGLRALSFIAVLLGFNGEIGHACRQAFVEPICPPDLKAQRRAADAIGNAVKVMPTATGEGAQELPAIFVHISAVERSGTSNLSEGQKVRYEVETDQRRGKQSAVNLKPAPLNKAAC